MFTSLHERSSSTWKVHAKTWLRCSNRGLIWLGIYFIIVNLFAIRDYIQTVRYDDSSVYYMYLAAQLQSYIPKRSTTLLRRDFLQRLSSWARKVSRILIKKTTALYSRTRSASYFHTYTIAQFPCVRCQLQNGGTAARRYVVLSKIITSASSTWHEIRQRYVDQNWLDHIAWQRRDATAGPTGREPYIYREILRVVKRFWTRHGKVGAPPFLRPVINFAATKIQPSVPCGRRPPPPSKSF